MDNNVKIYARQVPPEWQESPLFWDEDINAEIYGNKNFKSITSEFFDKLPAALEDLSCVWDNIQSGAYNGAIWADELNDILPPQGRPEYTREERRDSWPRILNKYTFIRNDLLCDALELITGKKWSFCTLRGCCQGDWQYCIYPAAEWDGAALERLEAEYFNTGTEWIIHDDENAPEAPEDVNGYSLYCTSWNDDGIKKEIAEAAGGSPADVTLYKFTEFTRIARYTEV